ncbi:hypothetical protein [Marininema halotolerans]|uniref:Lipoprotein n=1 Tax=Marininema halotolerans TaxID=1155944 RepID=A0A1I6UNE4_9BACL|nr:hypothetical protein [Marininema halotolerans]SFT02969.1 hypothetical protein SAMN05444972_11849 [Marininema halotolerans]
MKKITNTLLVLSITALLLGGCSQENTTTEKSFDSESEAIKAAMKDDSEISRIIGESPYVNKERIVVYLYKSEGDEGIGTATLTHKGKSITWTKNGPEVMVKYQQNYDVEVHGVVKSASGKKYDLYAGVAHRPHQTIDTQMKHDVKPKVDKKSKIYYYLVPITKYR